MKQCLEHDIPAITYPVADMTSCQLELAVLRPFRFEKRVQQSEADVHSSHFPVTRVLTLRLLSDDTLSGSHAINSVFVVPGGRYILSSSYSGWVRCWDLGSSVDTNPSSSPRAVASYFVSPSAFITVQRSHESPSSLVVGVASGPTHGDVCVRFSSFQTFCNHN